MFDEKANNELNYYDLIFIRSLMRDALKTVYSEEEKKDIEDLIKKIDKYLIKKIEKLLDE